MKNYTLLNFYVRKKQVAFLKHFGYPLLHLRSSKQSNMSHSVRGFSMVWKHKAAIYINFSEVIGCFIRSTLVARPVIDKWMIYGKFRFIFLSNCVSVTPECVHHVRNERLVSMVICFDF